MDKNTLFVSIAVFFLGCLVGLNGIYLPKMEALRVLQEKQREEEERMALTDEMTVLEEKIASHQEHLITPGKEELELLNRVRDIAEESNVRVISMTPIREREKRKRYQKFSLQISFQATYHLLGDFVSKIESSEKIMRIESLEFLPRGMANELPLECTMTLSIFTLP